MFFNQVYQNVLCVFIAWYLFNSTDDYAFIIYLNLGKPVMIVTEYMENGSLDSFLRVSRYFTYIYIFPPYLYLSTNIYKYGINC